MREVDEETGLRVRLGPRLPDQHYTIASGQPKVVAYWAAQPPADADIARVQAQRRDRRAAVGLGSPRRARSSTYQRDVELLDAFAASASTARPLLVVRHAQARSRKGWRGDDSERPLEGGRASAQAEQLVAAARARTASARVVSSDAARCVDTVLPYVNSRTSRVRLEPRLSRGRR